MNREEKRDNTFSVKRSQKRAHYSMLCYSYCRIVSLILIVIIALSRYAFGYSCSNKSIRVTGVADKMARLLYSSVLPSYMTFRRRFGVDVTVNALPSSVTAINYAQEGFVGQPVFIEPTMPVVFAHTPYDVTLHNNEVQFPIVAQGIAIIYNLPGITNLNLSSRSLASIYNGTIVYWNDTRIKQYNPNADLPYERIKAIARLDAAATTVFFTTVLSNSDNEWNKTYGVFSGPQFVNDVCCNSSTWPSNNIYMYGNEAVGVVGIVSSINYTIGYVLVGAISQYTVSVAGLLMSKQDISFAVLPSYETVRKKMYTYVERTGWEDVYVTADINFANGSYPFTIYAYLIVNFTYHNSIDCCVIRELAGLIEWLLSTESDNLMIANGYIPIIDELAARIAKKVLPKLQCSESYVYADFLATLKPSVTKTPTWLIVSIVAVCVLIASSVGMAIYFAYFRYCRVVESGWLIDWNRLRMPTSKGVNGNEAAKLIDSRSIASNQLPQTVSTESNPIGRRESIKTFNGAGIKGMLDGSNVNLEQLCCKDPKQWSKTTKRLMNRFRILKNKNVATMLGVSTNGSEVYVAFEFCVKGALHYVLRNVRYNLSDEIKTQFAVDVAQGLHYLHRNGIVHGYLNSLTCYLDGSWTVKITRWERLAVYRTENEDELKRYFAYDWDSSSDETRLIELLYVDPAILDQAQYSVDVLSLGFLFIEIFTSSLPYADVAAEDRNAYEEILTRKFGHFHIVQPRIIGCTSSNELYALVKGCLSATGSRPTVGQILDRLKRISERSSGIADIIMDVLEKHAEALEEKVEERTAKLKRVTEQMQHLLHEVLPSGIARKLMNGEAVPPEQFDCVTVYFSDIVGFTNISARSNPTQVMTLLNDLWLTFDTLIEKYDVYKVDTIGDAYMVCSGLPNRNGTEHCRQIALLSLALLGKCNTFKIQHLPQEKLRVRIGINSGPATAGVVGSKMPQYCVFGDTVNTAARMESTSSPEKIQMTEVTKNLLNEYFEGSFELVYRGEIDVKGKGEMKTYWLNGAKD